MENNRIENGNSSVSGAINDNFVKLSFEECFCTYLEDNNDLLPLHCCLELNNRKYLIAIYHEAQSRMKLSRFTVQIMVFSVAYNPLFSSLKAIEVHFFTPKCSISLYKM